MSASAISGTGSAAASWSTRTATARARWWSIRRCSASTPSARAAARPRGSQVVGCLNLSPERQAAAQLLNFDGLYTVDNIGDSGYAALRRIWNSAERGAWPDDLAADLWQALIDIDDTAAGLMGRFGIRQYRADQRRFSDVVELRGGAQSGQPGAPRRRQSMP